MSPWPHLTESWAGAYFQVTTAILIFGVGLPALVLQAIVHEDVRRIVYRHRKWLRSGLYFIFIFAFITLSFIWVFHPDDSLPSGAAFHDNGAAFAARQDTSRTAGSSSFSDAVSSGIMTLVILSLLPFSYWLASYRRDRVLNYLGKRCKRKIIHSGSPDEEMLADLQYLGEQASAGIEKEQSLKILGQLANQIQKQQYYKGNGLEPIVKALEVTLRGGDVENFSRAAKIFQKLIIKLQQGQHADAPDMGAILRVLQRVGCMALEVESELAALAILDIIMLVGQGTDGAFQLSNPILFELGIKALEKKRFLFAVAVLNRLETMIMHESSLTPIKTVNYLGLLAHFWNAGTAAQERAHLSLKNLDWQAAFQECLLAAREYHVAKTQFDTVDKLDIVCLEISATSPKPPHPKRKRSRSRTVLSV